ncbi:EF-hand domain-containing protein [Ectothiorhodospiraceae bacterium WFHF3C12]|nr:EF-hand domain-containing protein [Ectothiorhodospiraceae bacterium WFHF3C12]
MKHRKLILAAAVVTAAASSLALAGPGSKGGPGGMAFADTDGDGEITIEEIQARHAELFHASDADGDGNLNVEEMQNAMLRQRAQRRVQALDTDGDGTVSAEEFQAPMRWHLSRMDRDDDGEIGPREMGRGRHERWDDDDHHRGGYRDDD